MRIEAKFSKFFFLGILFFGLPAVLFTIGFIHEAFPVENFTYSFIWLLVWILFTFPLFNYWRHLRKIVFADTYGIGIRMLFTNLYFEWKDLNEIGRFKRVTYPRLGGGDWVYYIKVGINNKKYILGNLSMTNIEQLVQFCITKIGKERAVNLNKNRD